MPAKAAWPGSAATIWFRADNCLTGSITRAMGVNMDFRTKAEEERHRERIRKLSTFLGGTTHDCIRLWVTIDGDTFAIMIATNKCKVCGAPFEPSIPFQKFCCPEHEEESDDES
jgi:hypothetical protein